MPNNNPEKHRIYLFRFYHSITDICFDNNEIETAKSILDEIKIQSERICNIENTIISIVPPQT